MGDGREIAYGAKERWKRGDSVAENRSGCGACGPDCRPPPGARAGSPRPDREPMGQQTLIAAIIRGAPGALRRRFDSAGEGLEPLSRRCRIGCLRVSRDSRQTTHVSWCLLCPIAFQKAWSRCASGIFAR